MKKMMKKIIRGQRGLTLVEIMVVISILSILAAIIASGVLGTRTTSEKTQVKQDAQQVQTAVQRFQSEDLNSKFPDGSAATESLLDVDEADEDAVAAGTQLKADWDLNNDGTEDTTALPVLANYVEIDWAGSTIKAEVRQPDGTTKLIAMVPGYLVEKPESIDYTREVAAAAGGGAEKDYIWLMKKENVGTDKESRTVVVFTLNDARTAYRQLFP